MSRGMPLSTTQDFPLSSQSLSLFCTLTPKAIAVMREIEMNRSFKGVILHALSRYCTWQVAAAL